MTTPSSEQITANHLPDIDEELQKIQQNIYDLIPIINETVAHGSWVPGGLQLLGLKILRGNLERVTTRVDGLLERFNATDSL